jgi:hypothetical protein
MEWESRHLHYKAGGSLKNFLFTLKNPHNISAGKFALKAEKKDEAIFSDSTAGSGFAETEMTVYNDCNADNDSCTALGNT